MALGWARLHRGQERSPLPRSTGAPPVRSPCVSGEEAQVHKRHVPGRMCAGTQNPHECSSTLCSRESSALRTRVCACPVWCRGGHLGRTSPGS